MLHLYAMMKTKNKKGAHQDATSKGANGAEHNIKKPNYEIFHELYSMLHNIILVFKPVM